MASLACNNALLSTSRKSFFPTFFKGNASKTLNLPIKPFSLSTHFSKQPSTLKTLNPKPNLTTTKYSPTTNKLSLPDNLTNLKTLKTRLADGETLYGLFLLSFSPTLAEIAGLAGYDFVVVDMEHGYGGISAALPCLHALAATGTPAILRLPESCPTWAKKALDLGPQGIMFPMIESPKLAKKAVSYCRFPPAGVRGSAHPVVRASSYGIDDGYLSNYEDELLIMCQVESEEGVKKIEEIASVEGVDCIQMGPLDLSANLGYLWDPANKKVKETMRMAEKAVKKTTKGGKSGGAYLGGFALPCDGPLELRKRGYHMVSGAVDLGMFRSAAVEDVRRFKDDLSKKSDNDDNEEEEKEEEEEEEEEEEDKEKDEKYWSE